MRSVRFCFWIDLAAPRRTDADMATTSRPGTDRVLFLYWQISMARPQIKAGTSGDHLTHEFGRIVDHGDDAAIIEPGRPDHPEHADNRLLVIDDRRDHQRMNRTEKRACSRNR